MIEQSNDKVIFCAKEPIYNPEYKTSGSAGWDLRAFDGCIIWSHETVKVPSWLKVKLPEGYALIVKPRSSSAVKKWLLVIEWVIDSDYVWEISIVVHNLTDKPVIISKEERIAQAIIIKLAEYIPAYSMNYDRFAEEYPTDRWEWWFWSTWIF